MLTPKEAEKELELGAGLMPAPGYSTVNLLP